jgi:hypothetical protein
VPRGRGPLSVYSADQGGGGRPGVGAASEDGALTVAGGEACTGLVQSVSALFQALILSYTMFCQISEISCPEL